MALEKIDCQDEQESLREVTRRHFFGQCAVGLGTIALNALLADDGKAEPQRPQVDPARPMAARRPPLKAKAKRVIYLFMAGAPSQLELFSDKPRLRELTGQPPPESLMKGRRFAFLKGNERLLGTRRSFAQYGQCGMTLSELLPHHRKIVDEVTWLRGMSTDVFNHGPAKLFMNTGFQIPGRPSFGSWVTYGLGSENADLPGFVVLQSGRRGPRGGSTLWSSGFLPTSFQGVPFRGQGDAILNLRSPAGIDRRQERDFYDAVGTLNRARLEATGDPEIMTRVNAYEMAYRMQTSAPELMDIASESKSTLDLYGVKPGESGFAANALLARRMIERGVRFVQLYHTDWDHHGEVGNTLGADIENRCREVDQASAALVLDLKQRGLLEDTLVIWGGEFGRTPLGEVRQSTGRDHHINGFTIWIAGGGVKAGYVHGATDELGFGVIEGGVHVHDLHATLLHLLGFDHQRLTYRFQGRDFRLTDVHGRIVNDILV
ncbi:MAG: hypothetical protein RIR52_486 [Acidobacteriota bacterium]|jgi:hypothetical protein